MNVIGEENRLQWPRRVALWFGAGLVAVLIMAWMATPNLLRSRIAADQAVAYRAQRMAQQPETMARAGLVADQDGVPLPAGSAAADFRKVVQTGTLVLAVDDVAGSLERVRALVRGAGGYVEKESASRSAGEVRFAAMTLRVPAASFDALRAQLRQAGARVESEQIEAREVTGEYVDLESSLRNYRAEEQQYLAIMGRAGTIKDTLEVAQRLAQVRLRIEQTQGRLNLLEHQVAMASLDLTLRNDAVPPVATPRWQPLARLQSAFSDALSGLEDYVDTIAAIALHLPLALLWFFTVAGAAAAAWRMLRWMWRRFFVAAAA